MIGKSLAELGWREKAGVNIAAIHRGDKNILIPKANEQIFPFDKVSLIGTDEQLAILTKMLEQETIEHDNNGQEADVSLQAVTIGENSELIGKTIRESGVREKVNGLIVGIERNGQRVINPESHWVLQKDDIVWIAGDAQKLGNL